MASAGLVDRLRRVYEREEFDPGALGVLINPFYFARKGLIEAVRRLAPEVRGRVLDVGCGCKPYRELFTVDAYIGLDTNHSGHDHGNEDVDVLYDGETIPFGAAEFDSVVCFQVLEHVFHPARFLDEISRVLRPGGVLLLTVPFVWDEHEQPYDFARYSSFGLTHLLTQHGFEVVAATKSCPDSRTLFQMVNAYATKLFPVRDRLGALARLCITAPVTVVGMLTHRLTPSNADLYLDNIVLARRRSS